MASQPQADPILHPQLDAVVDPLLHPQPDLPAGQQVCTSLSTIVPNIRYLKKFPKCSLTNYYIMAFGVHNKLSFINHFKYGL